MRKGILCLWLLVLLPTTFAAAQTTIKKPALDRAVVRHPLAEKIDRQVRPWLTMEINDFRTLWNGRPMYLYTLNNHSREASGQLEVTTSYARDIDGPWEDTYVLGHMSIPPGSSQGPVIQTFPGVRAGSEWRFVRI